MPFFIWLFWLCLMCSWLPTTWAIDPQLHSFPDPLFSTFSTFILDSFGANITLTTVLLILFSLVDNPDLLNLYARQSHPQYDGENMITTTGWMKALACGLQDRLVENLHQVMTPEELDHNPDVAFANKLHQLTVLLGLTPYKKSGVMKQKIHQISRSSINSVRVICPPNMSCTTASCQPYHISLFTRYRDVPSVTLIEGTSIITNAVALAGECTKCKTRYHADHEDYKPVGENFTQECFVNSARYLKIGTNLWVDRGFTKAVYSGMYHFHASASAYVQFWNDNYGKSGKSIKLGRKQIWQAFVQESIRNVAQATGEQFEARQNLDIDDVCIYLLILSTSIKTCFR